MDVDEFIKHHGVKGMHWGVRKPRGDRSALRGKLRRKVRLQGNKASSKS
jgi:hypothetical protein